MSPTSVTFKCGSCGNLLSIGADLAGQVVRCPFCQQVVQVPASALPPVVVPEASVPTEPLVPFAGDAAPASPAANPLPVSEVETETIAITPGSSDSQSAPWLGEQVGERSRYESASNPDADPVIADRTIGWLSPAPSAASLASEADTAPVADTANPWEKTELLSAPPVSALAQAPSLSTPQGRAAAEGARRKVPWSVKLLAVLIPYSVMATAGVGYVLHSGLNRPPHPLEELQDQGIYEHIAFDGRRRENLPNIADTKETKKPDIQNPLVELASWMPRVKLGERQGFGKMDGIEVTPIDVTRRILDFVHLTEDRQPLKEQEVLVLRLKIRNTSGVIFHPDDPTFNRAWRKEVKPYTFLEIGDKQFYGVVHDPLTERVKGANYGELLPGGELETLVVAHESEKGERAVDLLAKLPSNTPLLWRVHLRKGREDIRLKVSGQVRTLWTTTIVPVSFTPADVRALGSTSAAIGGRPSAVSCRPQKNGKLGAGNGEHLALSHSPSLFPVPRSPPSR